MSLGFRAIPAAAGYPQYSGTALMPAIHSDRVLERFYCSSLFSDISTTEYMQEMISKRGDMVTFMKEPCGIRIQDHIKDGPIEHDTLELEEVTFVIDKAKQYSLKIARIDQYMMGDRWDRISQMVIKNASRSLAFTIDCELLNMMYSEASCNNVGPKAGVQSQLYDLGTAGAPVALTSLNIMEKLTHLQAVLDEQCVDQDGRFVVLPTPAKALLMNSQLTNASFTSSSGATSTYLNGKTPMNIAGFDIYYSNCAPRVFDAAVNTNAYYIVAGLKGATAFASVMDESRIASGAPHNFDTYYQGLMAYGYAIIYPEALTAMYARFN
jgi:hypothetical protein